MGFNTPYKLTMSMEREDFSFSEFDELPDDGEFDEDKLDLDIDEDLDVDDQYEMFDSEYSNDDE